MRLDPAVAGDVGLTRSRVIAELLEVTPSEVEIVAHIWKGAVAVAELDVTLGDAGVIEIEFGDEYGWLANDAYGGVWLLEYQCEFGDGDVLTVPAGWPDEIVIRDAHDPEVP